MKLLFREAAIADLHLFIRHYENAFLELYRDTGIWSEDAIIENMRHTAKKLFGDIFSNIEKHMDHPRVLGRKKMQGGLCQLCFYVGTRLVVVYYSEEKDMRWVESIAIDRKPIIF